MNSRELELKLHILNTNLQKKLLKNFDTSMVKLQLIITPNFTTRAITVRTFTRNQLQKIYNISSKVMNMIDKKGKTNPYITNLKPQF